MKRDAFIDCCAEIVGANAVALSRSLHVDLVGVAVVSQDHRYPGHALPADETNLNGTLVAIGNDGGKAAFGKIDGLDRLAALLKDLAQRELDRFQLRLEQPEVGTRKTRRAGRR